MENNLCDKYIDSLKEIEGFSIDAIVTITDLYKITRCERETLCDVGEGNASSDLWEKWIRENEDITKRLKVLTDELNEITLTFKD